MRQPRLDIGIARVPMPDADAVSDIEVWADQLVASVSMDPTSLLQRVADVVTAFGIIPVDSVISADNFDTHKNRRRSRSTESATI